MFNCLLIHSRDYPGIPRLTVDNHEIPGIEKSTGIESSSYVLPIAYKHLFFTYQRRVFVWKPHACFLEIFTRPGNNLKLALRITRQGCLLRILFFKTNKSLLCIFSKRKRSYLNALTTCIRNVTLN